jgi:hypothetical protein
MRADGLAVGHHDLPAIVDDRTTNRYDQRRGGQREAPIEYILTTNNTNSTNESETVSPVRLVARVATLDSSIIFSSVFIR